MDNDFNIVMPTEQGKDCDLVCIASSVSIDRDGEKMSDKALNMMRDDIKKKGVNLFLDHEHHLMNTIGHVYDAEVTTNKELKVKIMLDDPTTNGNVAAIKNKIKKGIRIGASVGGNVGSFKWEYDKVANKKVKVLDEVQIYELSLVGIPSNPNCFASLPQAIAKSFKEKQCPICYSQFNKSCSICGYQDTIEKSWHVCEDCAKKPRAKRYERQGTTIKIMTPENAAGAICDDCGKTIPYE